MRLNIPSRAAGFTMLEVLVSLLIAVFGLLGLIGLQAQAQVSEFESYQRAQALILANDMADRIAFNRGTDASGYVIGWRCYAYSTDAQKYLGSGNTVAPVCADGAIAGDPKTRADADLAAWNDVLQGAAETDGERHESWRTARRARVHHAERRHRRNPRQRGMAGNGAHSRFGGYLRNHLVRRQRRAASRGVHRGRSSRTDGGEPMNRRAQQGLSLLELMIALTIGLACWPG